MKSEDGGPAFPRTAANPEWGRGTESFEGMSMRDWFAGQALAGMLTNADMPWSPNIAEIGDDAIARASYDLADALLAERAKRKGE